MAASEWLRQSLSRGVVSTTTSWTFGFFLTTVGHLGGFLDSLRSNKRFSKLGLRHLLAFSGAVFAMTSAGCMGCSNAEFGKALDLGIGYNQGYQPDQPIPFDHSFHAGELKMDCQYCHSQVEKARHAGAPSLAVCMNCHLAIRQANGEPSEHIANLVDAYQNDKSIEWVRVHMLPDHARFNHAAHVKQGVSCQTCHGPVEEMKQVYQHSTLSMGWCVNCHRENETGKKGPLNCSTCHY